MNCIVSDAAKHAGSYNPFVIAQELGIDVQYTDKLPSDQYGLAVPDLDVIFLSLDVKESRFRYFLCAHELKHIVEDSGMQSYYNLSSKTKNQIEYEANQKAVRVLIAFYNAEHGIHHCVNCQHIMSTYGIPCELHRMVETELRCWYSKNKYGGLLA